MANYKKDTTINVQCFNIVYFPPLENLFAIENLQFAIIITPMFYFIRSHINRQPYRFGKTGNAILLNGIFLLLFGFLILMQPELLAYMVAFLVMFVGLMLVMVGWRMRR